VVRVGVLVFSLDGCAGLVALVIGGDGLDRMGEDCCCCCCIYGAHVCR
jgi:hypothetical protein